MQKVFDGIGYTAEMINLEDDIDQSERVVAKPPRVAPSTLTTEWIVEEVKRAAGRDMQDTFYTTNRSRMEGLEDTMYMRNGYTIVVFDSQGYMLGKIECHIDDATITLNVMYLYAFGDRRRKHQAPPQEEFHETRYLARSKPNKLAHISSAYIMWYFAAMYAYERYGPLARVLIMLPRDTIYKLLVESDARFVKLDVSTYLIDSKLAADNSNAFHNSMLKRAMGLANNDFEHIGAMYCAHMLMHTIDRMEQRAIAIRSIE